MPKRFPARAGLTVFLWGFGLLLARTEPVRATTADCRDYSAYDYLLPHPLGSPAAPRKLDTWGDLLVVLQPDGLFLLGTTDPNAPDVVNSVAGDFPDFALGDGAVAVNTSTSIVIYSLPELVAIGTISDLPVPASHLAIEGDLLAATFGRLLQTFDITDPRQPVLLGELESPQYNSGIGLGPLQLVNGFVLAHAYGGNNIWGYHTALSVFDVRDPSHPQLTDYLTQMPDQDPDRICLFMDLLPHGPGFLLGGLVTVGDIRPEYTRNDQFLARIVVNDQGVVEWRGIVKEQTNMSRGMIVEGNWVLWNTHQTNYVVDIDWNLATPAVNRADHNFPTGPTVWLREKEVLAVGNQLFHLADIRIDTSPPGNFSFSAWDQIEFFEEKLAVGRYYASHSYVSVWVLGIVDFSQSPPALIDRMEGDNQELPRIALLDRRVYYNLGGQYYLDINSDGTFSAPQVSPLPAIWSILPWNNFHVVAHTNGLLGIYEMASDQSLTMIGSFPGAGNGLELTRIGDVLLASGPYGGGFYDLSDPTRPTRFTLSTALEGATRYSPESNLIFAFKNSRLRWFSPPSPLQPAQLGEWQAPSGEAIRDVHLIGNSLYVAFGTCGFSVYEFDVQSGLSLVGGDTRQQADQMVPVPDNQFVLLPLPRLVPLDCNTPTAVAVSGFQAGFRGGEIHLTWQCQDADGPAARFEVVRRSGGSATTVASLPVRLGDFSVTDPAAQTGGDFEYLLFGCDNRDGRWLLDSCTLAGQPALRIGGAPIAYPNPANPTTSISFSIPRDGPVRLSVYGLDGRLVLVLADERLPAGSYERLWHGTDHDGRAVASGTYFLRLETDTRIDTGRLSLVR
jgi:hypothetical protein